MEGIRIFKKRFHFLSLQYVGEFSITTPAQKSHFGQKSTPKVVRPYTGFCVGLTKTCVGVSETWPPYTSCRIALTVMKFRLFGKIRPPPYYQRVN